MSGSDTQPTGRTSGGIAARRHPSGEEFQLAFGILSAALGEVRAWALWNHWTAEQRAEVATFAEDHFGAQLRSLADELIAWEERHGEH